MEALLPLIGVGGGTAAALLILALLIRGAISAAVEQAGKAEITKLDASLKEKLAERRQDFERDLDEARRASAKDLESFKAELTLAAEVRRQAATRKVEALIKIATLGEALQRALLNVRPGSGEDRTKAMAAVNEYVGALNVTSFLFEAKVVGQFRRHVADLMKAEIDLNTKNDASAIERAMATADAFLELARQELGVSARPTPLPVASAPQS